MGIDKLLTMLDAVDDERDRAVLRNKCVTRRAGCLCSHSDH
jgi:hypothetical protein